MALGSPLFEDAVVHLSNGQPLHVIGHGAADDAPFVQALLLDSEPYESARLAWDQLENGATLEFSLTPTSQS